MSEKNPKNSVQFLHDPMNLFAGGGEMGALMQHMDWAATRLGPVESWSPALRMMVRFLLANRFPLLLWWGPNFCQLYNDAYRPILGTKHPQRSLGQPARECWSEIWHILEPLIRTPFEGGPSTWMEDIPLEINRHGFVEETHFTIAYSPVPDESAPRGIGGVLATVHEISEKVVGERRTMALRDLGAGVLEERNAEEACGRATAILANYPKDVPFNLLYLLGHDQKTAKLAGSSGIQANTSLCPDSIQIVPNNAAVWPLHKVSETGQIALVELNAAFGDIPSGPWSDPPTQAAIVPVHSNTAHQLAGFLVAGLSPRLRFGDSYRGFLELASSQIATAVANARAYEEEKKRAEALAEIDRAKTTFFTNISHEFRTPLTLLLSPIEETLGRSNAALGQDERSHLEVAHRNGMRLLKLVNSLLDFARIEAGRIQASYEPVDLCSLTTDLASMFRSVIERAGLYLEIECAPLHEPIYVDREMWEKIVLNLISNAFKFTFNGGIRVQVNDRGKSVELTVLDTGTGIAESALPRLFERFHRVEGAAGRTFEGSGIGLALVQELVKLHGGRVTAESAVGCGSTFRVFIPKGKAHLPQDRIQAVPNKASTIDGINSYVAEALKWIPQDPGQDTDFPPLEDVIGRQKSAVEDSPQSSSGKSTVLLADDNTDMREYLQKLLEKHYSVIAVSNGVEALKVVERSCPDLILTDVMMPLLDGFGLLHAVRENPATRAVPVIILSARAGEEARIEGGNAGADDYLVKPFSARELLARVNAQLKLTAIRREADDVVRESEKKFRAFVNASSDVVYRMSPDWAEMWQLDGQGFISDTAGPKRNWIDEYIDPEDQPTVLRAIENAIHTKSTFELEHRVRQVDGTLGWTFSRAVPILDKNGEILEWLGAAKNVTARKNAETELYELNLQLQAELAAGVRMQQLSARLLQLDDFNQLLSEILEAAIDISHADMGNIQLFEGDALKIIVQRGFEKPFLDFFNSVHEGHAACGTALREAQRVIVEDVTKSPIFAGSEALQVMLDAGARAVQSTPLIDQSGQVLGMFSTHYRTPRRPADSELRTLDVLGRLAAELIKRKQAEDALRHSEQRLRLINDASPIMVWMSGTDKLCYFFNKTWLEFVGRTLEQEAGNGWAENVHPEDFDRCLQIYINSFDARSPFQMEYRLRHHSGQYRWILDSGVPRYASDGTFEGYVGGCLDIHEQKEAAEKVRIALEALRESELWLAGQKQAFQAAMNGAPLAESLNVLIKTACEQFGGEARCAFYLADDNRTALHHVVGMSEDYAECVDGFKIGPESLACGLAVHTGQPRITPDVREDPLWKPWLWLAEKYEYRGCWSFPVKTSAGRTVGTFAMYFKEPRQTTARDLDLANVLTNAAGIIISRHEEAKQREQVERVLRENEERLRLAQQGAEIGAFEWDIQSKVNSWTPELEAIYGLRVGTFEGTQEAWERLVHSEDRPAVIKKVEMAFQTGMPTQGEWRVVWPDGSIHWILGRWQVFKDQSGKPTRMAGINIDVTQRKAADEARSRLAALVESSDDAIVSKDLNGIVTSWNPQAERLFGYKKEEIIGRSILTIIPPELHGDEDMILGKIKSGQKIDHFETIRVAKSGERIEVSLSISPVIDERGNIIGAAKIARDIRGNKKIERALRTTEKLAAAGRLAATVAHEINNPLEAVNNLVFLAKRDLRDTNKVTEYLRLAERELDRVAHIARQTLGFYRDTSAPARFGVVKAIDDLLYLYEKRLETRNIRVIKQYRDNPEIKAFAGEIRQSLSNLISNAIDAMPSGGSLVVRVSEVREWSNSLQAGVRITILDTGTGIPLYARKSLFEPFFTTKTDVGTGLGLWITKNIVEKHHGNIRFVSRTGPRDHGTAFSIFLPLGIEGHDVQPRRVDKPKATVPSHEGR